MQKSARVLDRDTTNGCARHGARSLEVARDARGPADGTIVSAMAQLVGPKSSQSHRDDQQL